MTATASKSKGKRVVHTTTMQWDFPYCAGCLGHVQALKSATTTLIGGCVGSVFLGLVMMVAVAAWFGMLVMVAGIGCIVYAYTAMMKSARAQMRPSCACLDCAVNFVNWSGTHQIFEMHSAGYALAFMHANAPKLVNLNGPARQLYEMHVGAAPNAPQTARKTMR